MSKHGIISKLSIITGMAEIVNGPSKFDLMTSLFVRDKDFRPMQVTFTIGDGKRPLFCVVNGVDAEDGSGESWMMRGFLVSTGMRFEGYYRTDRRSGWIKEVPSPTKK